MQRLKFITLALVAALAMSVVASASAAKPEWGKGGAVITENVSFTATSGAGKLETANGKTVECTEDEASGEITPPKGATKVLVTFKHCKLSSGPECGTAGEIKTTLLEGELLYVDAKHEKVGLLLKPKALEKFAVFTCDVFGAKVKIEVGGEVIGEVEGPYNVEKTEGKLIFRKGAAKGQQQFEKKEEAGEAKHLQCMYEEFFVKHNESCAIESSDTITWSPAGTKVEVLA